MLFARKLVITSYLVNVFNLFLVRLRQNLIFEKRKVEHFDLLFLSSFHFSFCRDDEILACVCVRSAYIFGHLEREREREREREWAEKASPKPTNKKQNYG